ncbi:NAD-dependent epimerase/dehydratase family protein [Ancylobacter sp. A5.8]|uniref:NAD-dependent epimerase/dehydratase family protein n=1 Tax=Ancylobacter gelatini TaxID=2919920 RepID=UPI001F4D6CEF|nr:NAD-dependent epimerase/dehydratase family protein [Ancylobacter gelatini]MCJ8142808.1 NAD-dependent epimerase/dehydratase family protein [Ancylobacter gelatini]
MTQVHLLLGGCGFVGRHVALLLAKNGHDVVLADRSPIAADFPEGLAGKISWRELDLAKADWADLVRGVDVVHHYAWGSIPATANEKPAGDLLGNVVPTIALLEVLRNLGRERAPRLVFTSSGGTVYGSLQQIPVAEEHPLNPLNAYGAGKATAELYITAYARQYGLDCRVARLSNPYGAGQNLARGQGAVTTFLHRALNREPIVIWGDGEVVRDYIHIADVADGLCALACMDEIGVHNVFNLGSGHGVSLNAVVAQLEAGLGRRLDVRREAARPYDVPVSVLDISRMRDILHWGPRLNLSDGIRRTLSDLEGGRLFSSLG